MKSIKLIIKGILLWISALVVVLSICSIDSIADKSFGWLFGVIVLNFTLISICYHTITEKEYKIVSGYNLVNKAFGLED